MVDPISLFASPVVNLAVQKLAAWIEEGYRTLAEFKNEVRDLEKKLKDIQAIVENAEKCYTRPAVSHLLEELKDATNDAENVLDMVSMEAILWNEMEQQVRFLPSGASNWIFRIKNRSIPNQIKEIVKTYDDILERSSDALQLVQNLTGASNSQEIMTANPATGSSLRPHVVGRGEEKNRIIGMLTSDEFNMQDRVFWTPITGMGGIGKSTLAQQVYHDRKVSERFQKKIWISIPHREWSAYTRDYIWDAIKTACPKNNLSGSLEDVAANCVEGLKLLIVLDNVWSEDLNEWNNLERVLGKADRGTRVIVTSRSQSVFGFNPAHFPTQGTPLGYLPHPDCLLIFARNAIDGDIATLESKGVKEVADRIVEKCGGIPLVVDVIGCLLRTKPLDKWSDIVDYDLPKFEVAEARNRDYRQTMPFLKLSYFNLKPVLKQLFSLCSLFPEGHQFDKDELVKLWMAHYIIKPINSAQSQLDEGRENFDRLYALSFFQRQPDSEKYRMHDYMHELAKIVAGKFSCMLKDEKSTIDPQTHHISLICDKVEGLTETIGECKKLRTFLMPQYTLPLRNFGKTMDKMFRTLVYLRVLDLSSSRLSQLPETIAELKLLCYLNLSRTYIKWLPNALCNLRNLQTLKLLECPWFSRLPKNLSCLIRLQHLEIDDAFWKYRCLTQPPNVGRLTCLQNLHKFRVGESKNGSGIEELKDMKHLQGSLHILELNNAVNAGEAQLKDKHGIQVLELEWARQGVVAEPESKAMDDKATQILEALEPHSRLIVLKVFRYCGKSIPSWLTRGQLQFLNTLFLEECKNLEALTLGSHPNLEILCIKDMQNLREFSVEQDFPRLHTLKISNCPLLMQLTNIIGRLRFLKIKKCSSLKSIPTVASYYATLELIDNPALEGFQGTVQHFMYDPERCKIIGCPQFHGCSASYNNNKAAAGPPKLEIGNFESIPIYCRTTWAGELVVNKCHKDAFLKATTPNILFLNSLTISNISNLISFPTDWKVSLVSLYMRACKDLEALFDPTSSCQESFPCLVNLSINDCPKLSKFPEEGLPPKLELLSIRSCPNIESLGSPGVLKDLQSLADVYIEDCPKLHSFPAQGFPESLEHLRIKGCPQLTKKIHGNGPELSKVMNIPYLEIEALQAPSRKVFSCFQGF